MIDQTILAWAIPGSVEATVKGDVEGHEFHGNQYTSGDGGGESKAERKYEKSVSGRNQKLSEVTEGDVIQHLGKDYDVVAVKKIGGKQNRHDIIVKPHGEPEVKMVEGVGLNKGKLVPLYQKKALTFYNTGGDYSADNFSFKN